MTGKHVDYTKHIGYPHQAGYLWDCPECEFGPCQCAGTDWAPCVSRECTRESERES
jgi:hypothetical protein